MAGLPLLTFPAPALVTKSRRFGGGGQPRLPDHQHQAQRLTAQFRRLQQAMDRQRIILQGNVHGLQPEQMLVLETMGSVENFASAVRRVEGLEWLAEVELDDMAPEHGFQNERDPAKPLRGQLFLVMSDQRALQQIQSLFDRWRQDGNRRFPTGLAPLRHVFAHLHTIRPWSAEDRVRETGVLENWQFRMEHGQGMLPFEAELVFRGDEGRRQQAEGLLRELIGNLGGEVVQQAVIPDIAYHAVLGRLPGDRIQHVLENLDVNILQCADVMFVRPVGQCAVRVGEEQDPLGAAAETTGLQPTAGRPIAALLDGVPLQRHALLNNRLIIDDVDGHEVAYQAKERIHGTAMASIICHGELDANEEPLGRPIYVRPILKPVREDGRLVEEAVPDDTLVVDLIHRAVRRLFEGDGDEDPAAPEVRIINLSVGDPSRPLNRGVSSLARLIDWLAWRYNVLFVISAGNHLGNIELDIPHAQLAGLDGVQLKRRLIEAIAADTRNRRLLSPAESFNGITVGAVHADQSTAAVRHDLVDPYGATWLPSTISAHGPGYRRTVKPDFFVPGGRQFLRAPLGNTHLQARLETPRNFAAPGQRVAAPGEPGQLDRTWYSRGTSNAAAIVTRWGCIAHDVIAQLRMHDGRRPPSEFDAVLLKTMLVHSASWNEAAGALAEVLRNENNGRQFKEYLGRFLGYGVADIGRVVQCTNQRATVLGVGQLENEQAHEFTLRLPPSLAARTDRRRLTTTLSWMTPISSSRQTYRVAHLWFDPKNDLAPDRINADHHAVQRGTVQHEVLEGNHAADYQDGESIIVKVNCRADAGDIIEPVRYALAVTLEVAEDVEIPIYQEIRSRLGVAVPVRGRGNR